MMELQPYALMLQQQFVRDLEAARPEYIVYIDVRNSWLPHPGFVNLLFEWWKDYSLHYEKVGVADLVSPDETDYYWDGAAAGYTPRDTPNLIIYRRIGSRLAATAP